MSGNKDRRTLKEEIALVIQGYKILFKIEKRFVWIPVVKAFLSAFMPFVNLFMSAKILTELTGAKNFKTLIIYAVVTISLNFITAVLKKFAETKENIYLDDWWKKFDLFFSDVNNNMQYEHLENPKTHILRDKIQHTQNTVGGGFASLYWNLERLTDGIFTVIFSVSLTAGMFFLRADGNFSGITGFVNSPYSAIIIVLLIFINAGATIWSSKNEMSQSNDALEEMAQASRLANYYAGNIYNSGGVMDIKIYNQTPVILEEVKKFGENVSYLKIFGKILYKFKNIQATLNAAVNIIIYGYIAVKAFTGAFGIGLFLQYTGAVGRFVLGVSNSAGIIADYPHNNIYLKNILDYINMPNNMEQGTLKTEKRAGSAYEIEFRNVSFKYPGTDTYALKNLSLKFNIGKRMAVVGMNGSGKTTMIKLLCRLYDPTDGVITLNGIDVKKYDYAEYMAIFSVVFQDFKLFSFTLGQNVSTSVDVDTQQAEKCLNMAGLGERLQIMPKGLETPLYKDFEEDGVEISGGEAQKIALARALYKDAPFIVLDEPTAALDPIAEFEVYSKFNEIVGGKTAIYISHRLSSCRFCDDIAVFHEGELIQRGSHDALIADENGKYHELWHAQAQYYAENKTYSI
ncbi:MAG: ABC transporter ATP-binding protein/permease [Oscillospiraceae bacterium]|nr:ABC transporter ATP-binding protein/permease [Oscillospiraceae bacterium]